MDVVDLERITKAALRELGAGDPPVTITPHGSDARWRVEVGGTDPATLMLRVGPGTTAQFVREQIFTQLTGR